MTRKKGKYFRGNVISDKCNSQTKNPRMKNAISIEFETAEDLLTFTRLAAQCITQDGTPGALLCGLACSALKRAKVKHITPGQPAPAHCSNKNYRYELRDELQVLETCEAASLDDAAEKFGCKIVGLVFRGMATLQSKTRPLSKFGVTWAPITKQ